MWNDLCALLAEPEPLAAAVARAHGGAWLPQELLARRETLRRAQAHLCQQIERLTDAYLRAVLSLNEYERRRRDLEQRVQALARQEELLRNNAERQQQLAGIAASRETFRARVQHGLAAATFEQRRQLVLLLVDRVIVTNAEVEIRYVLPTSPESEHVRFCHLLKDYFDPLADGLAQSVALVPGHAAIKGRPTPRGVLRHVRGHVHRPKLVDEVLRVISLVSAQRDPVRAIRPGLHHGEGGDPFGVAVGLGDAGVHDQPMAVLHQGMTHEAELGFHALALAIQPRLRIGGGGMGLVRAPLASEVDLGIAPLRRILLIATTAILRLEALH